MVYYLLSLWCFSFLVNYHFQVSFHLKVIFFMNVAKLTENTSVITGKLPYNEAIVSLSLFRVTLDGTEQRQEFSTRNRTRRSSRFGSDLWPAKTWTAL